MIGHRLKGATAMWTGNFAEGRAHLGRAIALYNPIEHRGLATRFGQDIRGAILFWRSPGLWMFGYPDAALADAHQALKDAREIGHAATLMFALAAGSLTYILCGNYAIAKMQSDEVIALADEKGTLAWKGWGMMSEGCVSALTNKASDAIQTMSSGISTWRSTGGTILLPIYLSNLATAYALLGKYEDAIRTVGEAAYAVQTSKETWCEAEVNRTVGEIALKLLDPDADNAEAHFERALAVARLQQAKSWELRAAISLARLWRDQGKRDAGLRCVCWDNQLACGERTTKHVP